LRRTDSVVIEGIADIRRSLAARRSDANDPELTFMGIPVRGLNARTDQPQPRSIGVRPPAKDQSAQPRE
jgi:hypothetical protein